MPIETQAKAQFSKGQPKYRFPPGCRIPWTGSFAAGGGDLQEECCPAKERGAPGKAGEWPEVGPARGGVQRARGCLRPEGPAGRAGRALAHRSLLPSRHLPRWERQELLAVRTEASFAGAKKMKIWNSELVFMKSL